MIRKPVIAGNWKMYKLLNESVDSAVELRSLVSNVTKCEIIIAPVFTAIEKVASRLEGANISVAAQNCSMSSEHSANTGEVCADMIKDVGASHIIVGHSERRQFYCETDEIVNKKTKACLHFGMTAIVCLGEMLEDREGGHAEDVVKSQLEGGLTGLTVADMERIIIAYEPVWAIGTGKTASPEQAQEMHSFIRRSLASLHGQDVANNTRILYGGSVKPANVNELMSENDIDGALVGGASLDPVTFSKIVHY